MRLAASWKRFVVGRRTASATASAALLSSAIVVAAVNSDGTQATNVQLNDGSVWVTNHADRKVGRLNLRIDELDFSIYAGAAPDVLQEDRTVLFSGRESAQGEPGGVQRLDVLSGQPSGSNTAPIVDYRIGGGVGALLDRETGKLWVGAADNIVAPDYPDKPDALVEPGSVLVVSQAVPITGGDRGDARGRVLIVDGSGWYEVRVGDDGEPLRPEKPADETSGEQPADTGATPDADGDGDAATEPGGTLPEAPPEPILEPEVHSWPEPFATDDVIDVTAVGGDPVVLLADGTVVLPNGATAAIAGESPRLQQPGPAAGTVLVASQAGLFDVKLSSAEVIEVAAVEGPAAAPVVVAGCALGAWAGDAPAWVKRCGATLHGPAEIPGATPGDELVWRVNGNNVALNGVGKGDVWADHDGTLAYVGNWDDVEPASEDSEDIEDTTGESRTVVERSCVEGGNEAPFAGDDVLGVRPRQSIIDLLNNDDDINCEPIAITAVTPSAGTFGNLTVIDNGQHVLFSPSDAIIAAAATSVQVFTFQYSAVDIAGHTSGPATVTVSVKDFSLGNTPPALRPKGDDTTREMRAQVEEGRSVSANVMAEWWDPDGDDLRLVSALPQGEGEVASTPDGVVRFTAAGVSPGIHSVDVTMSDGIASSTEAMEVTVKPIGSTLAPITTNDFATVVVGGRVTVAPLANDSDPNGTPLTLQPLWTGSADSADGGYTAAPLADGTTVEIVGNAPGVYALRYGASDGTETTEGVIRLEVVAPGAVNQAPIAVPDQVKLRPQRVLDVDVLANDVDADGDLLAVTDVQVADSDGSRGIVRASLVDRRMVQVEVVPGPNGETPVGPFVITYRITDGHSSERAADQTAEQAEAEVLRARGSITVLVQPPSEDQPPVLSPDATTVRSGDIAAVAVLRNDVDPDSDAIELVSVEQPAQPGAGVAWTEGREVYFQGGAPGTYSLLYTVTAAGKTASSTVTFVVTAMPDAATNPNSAPSPPDLVVRAIRGGSVRVNIPWTGADPDGDSVTLLDTLGPPTPGAATGNRVELDPDAPGVIWYTAGPSSRPVDSFTYTVQDRFGLRGTGVVTVMVIDEGGWPPQAHDDVLVGKPGRVLSIPVLANDSSPQDRPLQLDADPFFDLDGRPTNRPVNGDHVRVLDQTLEVNRGRIEVEVPTTAGTLVEHYRITDGFNPSDAYVRVTPDPDAPNLPPVAERDEVTDAEARGLTEVTVDVLANDVDPDDADSPLTLDLPPGQNATITGRQLVVPLGELAQIVLYRVTDSDGASAIGLVRVPGLENHPPVLSAAGRDPSNRTIAAGSAAPLPIPLTSIVEDPDGDPDIRLTDTEVINVTGVGEVARAADGSGFTFTPPAELSETTYITVTFEVTDRPGTSAEERQLPLCNCLARLSVDLIIEASSPPRVVSQGNVRVPQLDEPISFDLTPHVVDDQGDPLTYVLDESTFGGLTIEQSGPALTIVSHRAGDQKLPVGTAITVRYTVSDGVFEPVQNTFTVTIVATNKGQPAAATFPTFEAERDAVHDLPNFVDAAVNPFAGDGHALTMLNPSVTGGAQLTCTDAGACQFMSNTVGTFTVSYTLRDAVDQTATGTFTVVVKGTPRAPGAPVQESVGDRQVTLSWTAADDQGDPITAYHVRVVETGAEHRFTTTGGVVTGLQNAQTYHFTVVAENALGRGDVSGESSGMVPDRVPDPPEGLAFTDYQDRTLTLAWTPPSTAGDFSAITAYEVQIGGQTLSVDGGVTTLVVGAGGAGSPLINGADYSFRVRARNSATTNGGWGAWSARSAATERPSRYPDPPTNVQAVNAGDGGTPRITVTWAAPGDDGGRPIVSYQVCRTQTGACQTVSGGVTTATFDATRNSDASFTVVAVNSDKNRANSEPSAASPVVRAVGNPDAPTITAITSGNHQLTVVATPANNSGCTSASTEYSRDGGASWQSNATFTGLTNGSSYSFVARTRLAASCGTPGVTYVSVDSNTMSGIPYGPLVTPSISASGGGTTTITWNWSTNRGDDARPGWSATLSGDCGSQSVSTAPGASGSVSQSYSRDGSTRSCTITVSAPGQSAVSASASARVQDPPPPPRTVTVTRGGTGAVGGTTPCGVCYWINVTLDNFAPNTTYSISVPNIHSTSFTVTTNSSGDAFSGDGRWYCGPPYTAIAYVDGTASNTYTC